MRTGTKPKLAGAFVSVTGLPAGVRPLALFGLVGGMGPRGLAQLSRLGGEDARPRYADRRHLRGLLAVGGGL